MIGLTTMLRRSFFATASPLTTRLTSQPTSPLTSQLTPLVLARGMTHVKAHRVYPQWSSPPPKHDMWQPSTWLGAYYKLREGDPAAMRNRDRLMQKAEPKRGRFIVGALERMEMQKLQAAQPWRAGNFKPGDYLQVEHKATATDAAETIVGVMIGMHRRGLGSSFRLLCNPDNSPVEYLFQIYSPLIVNVTVRKASEWRNNQRKLFKLRAQVQTLAIPAPVFEGRERRVKAS